MSGWSSWSQSLHLSSMFTTEKKKGNTVDHLQEEHLSIVNVYIQKKMCKTKFINHFDTEINRRDEKRDTYIWVMTNTTLPSVHTV